MIKAMKFLVSLLLALMLTAMAHGQEADSYQTNDQQEDQLREPLPEKSDPIAEQLFATSVKAMGGPDAITYDSLSSKILLSRGPHRVNMDYYYKRPNKALMNVWKKADIGNEMFKVSTGYDGTTAWTFDESEEKPFPQKIGGEKEKEIKEMASADDLLLTYKEKGCVLEYLGAVNNRKQKNYLVKLYHPDGRTEYFYFHPKNYLITRRGNKQMQMGTPVNVDTYVVKYDKIDNKWVPVKYEIAYEDEVVMTMEFSNIKLNPPLNDAMFEMPKVKEVWLKGKNAQ